MRAILIGWGEVGRGLYELFSPYHQIDVYDTKKNIIIHNITNPNVLMIAIPYFLDNDDFISVVKGYQKEFNPGVTIIFSTVPIGTSSRLKSLHCPVEGRHPNMAEAMRTWTWWIGGEDEDAERFFHQAGLLYKVVQKPEYTEFMKLHSLTLYGLNIEFARYNKTVADKIGMSYSLLKQYDESIFDLCMEMAKGNPERYKKYILELDPPTGKIGGHCILPGTDILNSQYPSLYLKEILKTNESL